MLLPKCFCLRGSAPDPAGDFQPAPLAGKRWVSPLQRAPQNCGPQSPETTRSATGNSDKIKLQRGVRQGDNISPKLFTACLPLTIKINWEAKGINIDGEHLSHLIFADDIVMVAKSPGELESMFTDIHLASKPVGLSMNLSKTKMMLNESATTSTVAVDGNTIEKVDRYVYLDKTVTQAGDGQHSARWPT